jgi:hypothetical protein
MSTDQLEAYNRLNNLRALVDRISRACRVNPTVSNWEALDDAHAAIDRVTRELYEITREDES